MSKESPKKLTKQPTPENTLLEEEIDALASKFQDIIAKIASEKSSEKNPSGKGANKNSQLDSQAIKSEITKQLRSFNERTKTKIDELQQRYEQDIKNQQIKYSQLEEKLKQQQETIANSQLDEKDKEKNIPQSEIKVRTDLLKRNKELTKNNIFLVEENEKLRNKKNELKEEISKKSQIIDDLNQQMSNQYNESIEKITKKDQIIDNLTQKLEQNLNKYNESIKKITDEKKQQKEQLKKQLSKATTELSQSKETQASLTEQIKKLTENIDELKTENNGLKEETKTNKINIKKLTEEKTNNDKNINLLKKENQNLKTVLNSSETENQNLKTVLNSSEAENQNLKTENDQLKKETKTNKESIKKLLKEKSNNEKNINTLKEENKNLKSAFDSSEEEKQNLKQNLDKMTNKFEENKKLATKQKNMITELQAKQNEFQNTIKDQSQKIAENEEMISNLMKEKEEKEKENKTLQINYTDLKKKFTKLKNGSTSENDKLKAEILQLQESNKIMKQKITNFEISENNKNIVKEIFFNQQVFSDNDIINYKPEEIFIPQELSQESVQVIDYIDDIIPTVTFHFDKQVEEFNPEFFHQLLKETSDGYAVIISVEKGSTIVKVALALYIKEVDVIKEKLGNIVNGVKNKLKSSIDGKAIIGNLVDEPIVEIPDDEKIKEICSKPSLNLLQNAQELAEKIDVEEIKKEVIKFTHDNMANSCNFEYICSHQSLFDQMEMQVRNDIENNQFEMTIVGHTLIANKIIDNQYKKIKNKIPSDDVTECFLYHGSRLNNHEKIVKKHFWLPGKDIMEEKHDDGYYGKGVYATENIFYASMYSNGYRKLQINEKAYVLCCIAVYNKNMVKELYDLSYNGKEFDDDIKNNYGINHSFVGDCYKFHPIKNSDIDKCFIYGQEFVFSNKYQLVPLCSFTIMRKDHCIIWKDEHIENNENSAYMRELSKKMEINVYFKKSVDDALEMIKKKKRSKIKLITNGGFNLSGKTLIEKARQIVGSNFVCLVFASSPDHIKWVSTMENVLFTKSPADFRAFSELKMEKNDILNFAHGIEENLKCKFKINEKELLKFPYVKD